MSSDDQPDFQHPQYKAALPLVTYCEAVYGGKKEWYTPIAHSQGGRTRTGSLYQTNNNTIVNQINPIAEEFLPRLEREEFTYYYQRLARSIWQPFFRDTINGLTGLLSKFSLKPDLLNWLDEKTKENCLNNIDLEGSDIRSFFLDCDVSALRDGFCAVLVQFPTAPIASNAAEELSLDLRPYLVKYPRSQIINWAHKEQPNGELTLDLLILERTAYRRKPPYGTEEYQQIIEITPDYYQIWEPTVNREGVTNFTLTTQTPNSLGFIPVVFYSANTQNPFYLDPPFYAIAQNNVHHYQIYSDYREILHFMGCPIVVRKGLASNNFDLEALPPLVLGSRQVQDIPADGDIYIVSVPSEGATLNQKAALEIKQDILEQVFGFLGSTPSMTATEASMRATNLKSSLQILASEKESAIEEIFAIWGLYQGQEALRGQGIEISKSIFNFFTPQLLSEFRELLAEGFLDLESFWEVLGSLGTLPDSVSPLTILERLNANRELEQLEQPSSSASFVSATDDGNFN